MTARPPREYLSEPSLFGGGGFTLDPATQREGVAEMNRSFAARAQALIAHTVDRQSRAQHKTRRSLAKAAGIPERRLHRLLNGTAWMQLHDVVGLSRALDQDLFVVYATRTSSLATELTGIIGRAPVTPER